MNVVPFVFRDFGEKQKHPTFSKTKADLYAKCKQSFHFFFILIFPLPYLHLHQLHLEYLPNRTYIPFAPI